jgi:hypothetical protein
MYHQQTVELAIDTETERRIAATELLKLPEADFTALRRIAMANRVARQRGEAQSKFICAICRKPLYLSRYIREDGNRWFAHDGASPDCPWYEGNKLSPDMRRALIYRGHQEGAQHRKLKELVASWLEKEPGVTKINCELVTHGQILKGEWKRPDVQCVKDGRRIVFEIQLSYTFLSDVIKRDDFYRQERIFIIWLFSFLDLRRSTVRDEAFFNRRNVFVLDQTAIDESARNGRLTFNGTFQKPILVGNSIEDDWQNQLVTLDDVQFPTPSYRPYFFDYDAVRQALETKRAEDERKRIEAEREAQRQAEILWRQQRLDEWNGMVKRYLAATVAYCNSDYANHLRQPLVDIAEEMYESDHWHRGFECLKEEDFFGWHRVLPVLLSIKHNRPVGYHKYHSAYQVLEAGVRQTIQGRNRGFAVLYLWASYIYKPTLNQKQWQWRDTLAKHIKGSIEAGETTFRRVTYYDEAIGLLFPELEEKLCTPFATDRDNHPVATTS